MTEFHAGADWPLQFFVYLLIDWLRVRRANKNLIVIYCAYFSWIRANAPFQLEHVGYQSIALQVHYNFAFGSESIGQSVRLIIRQNGPADSAIFRRIANFPFLRVNAHSDRVGLKRWTTEHVPSNRIIYKYIKFGCKKINKFNLISPQKFHSFWNELDRDAWHFGALKSRFIYGRPVLTGIDTIRVCGASAYFWNASSPSSCMGLLRSNPPANGVSLNHLLFRKRWTLIFT